MTDGKLRPGRAEFVLVNDELAEVTKLRARLAEQTKYSAALQRLIECVCQGRQPPDDVREAAPHHAEMAKRFQAQIDEIEAKIEALALASSKL